MKKIKQCVKYLFKIENILSTIEKLETSEQHLTSDLKNGLAKFHLQIISIPIEYTAFGFYTLNYKLLAAVSKNCSDFEFENIYRF